MNMVQVMNYEEKTQARKVAHYNPNPRWPKGYYEVLHELGIEHQHHSFYSHWVSQFFSRHRGERRRRDLGLAEIEVFLKSNGRPRTFYLFSKVHHTGTVLSAFYR
jgi:hypothetical protein